MKDTVYYGISRNFRGLLERRYLYTGHQLSAIFEEKSPESKGEFCRRIIDGSIISFEGAFWANDTYTVQLLEKEDDVMGFVSGINAMADYEDPTALDCAEWYSSFETECMFTGAENHTAKKFLIENNLAVENLKAIDPRAKQLFDLGLHPCECYSEDLMDKRFSELERALKEGWLVANKEERTKNQ